MFFNLFRKKKQPAKRKKRQTTDSKIKSAFDLVKTDVDQINKKLEEHSKILSGQSATIEKNFNLIKKNSTKLRSLENLVKEPISQVLPQRTSQKISRIKRQLVATKLVTGESNIAIDNFSEQEKKILGVFLENKDMALSYVDIATSLGKSHNTIKNQISTMNLKSNMFERSVKDKRNRFKLKPGLKIEKSID